MGDIIPYPAVKYEIMSHFQRLGGILTILIRALTYLPILFRPYRAMNLAELDEVNNPS